MDVGIGCISLFGLIIAIFVGGNLVHKEIDRRTIIPIIVKPIERYEFIIGKYLGLLMTIFLNLILMTAGFYITLRSVSGSWNFLLLYAIFLIFIELMVISGLAVMFSSFASPLLSVILTLCCFSMGHLSKDFLFIIQNIEDPSLKFFCKIIYNIIPHLSDFDIKNELVHGILVSKEYILSATAYGIAYTITTIFLAIIIFNKRNFK